MPRTFQAAAVALFVATPGIALASDMSGMVTLLALAFAISPWAVLNLIAFAAYAFQRRYASRPFAVRHAQLAAAGPLLGLALALVDFGGSSHTEDLLITLAILGGMLLLACLPLAANHLHRHA
jgi:hypothetical protein